MNRVLVTGAGGYIGQHVSLALAQAGWQVRGLGRRPQPARLGAVEWVQGDIGDVAITAQATRGCATIVHLACLPLKQSSQDPAEALRINVGGTLRVLEAARKAEVERLIYTSTAQVYGGHSPLPNSEMQHPQPDSIYAASKLCGEVWCQAYAGMHGMPIQILRIFNVYGTAADGASRPTVEAIFVRQLCQGQRPQVRGHPQNGRDFIHVQDVVRALCLALTRPAWEGAVNIGTGTLTTLSDLARMAAHALGQAVEPEMIETGEPPVRFQADTTRAQALLDFRAEVTLAAGLDELAGEP